MSFWALQQPADQVACIEHETGRVWTYGQLSDGVEAWKQILPRSQVKRLGIVLCKNSLESLVSFLAALQLGDAVLLLNEDLAPPLVENIVQRFSPNWIAATRTCQFPLYRSAAQNSRQRLLLRTAPCERSIFPELAVLLSTSGSTGSPKLVRLSYKNVTSNAASIAEYLGLNCSERPVTTLPMPYAYGLSVINSHLLSGATLLLTNSSIADRKFWAFFTEQRASSLTGVPYTYQILLRMGLLKLDHPSLATLTQAGGRLDPKHIEDVEIASQKRWRFFVMYGQTEATARISYVPPELLCSKIGSIGKPIPGGAMRVDPDSGELIYSGPNVMLGYAENESDLEKGDELDGELHTGDLARRDEDGFFYLVGRMKRFLKIFGNRINLDEIEATLRLRVGANVACFGSDDNLCVAIENAADKSRIVDILTGMYGLRGTAYRFICVEPIPQTTTGKIDYPALQETLSNYATLQ